MGFRLLRRATVLAVAAALGFGLHAAPAGADSGGGFVVGAGEDALLWGNAGLTSSIARTLGLKAVRITIKWRPGQAKLSAGYQRLLDRLLLDSWGLRVVVSVYGQADAAPRTDAARDQYCGFVADLLRRNPTIDDVVIWNDPNDGAFWSPQFDTAGRSVAPADYEALLGRCWDAAHAVRKDVNVVALDVSKGSSAPGAFTLAWHPPTVWFRKLADAYRASGRTQRIFDTVGHIPHPDGSAERPWTRHTGVMVSEGDYDRLMTALTGSFGGTAQPAPGRDGVSIWYLAQGFQTTPDPAKAGAYSGTETDRSPVPARSGTPDTGEGPATDQGVQLADAIRIAYCQPNVSAFFNFHLFDESDLVGWQSGVFWADGSPKPSYAALRRVVGEANARKIDCGAFSSEGAPPRPAPTPATGPKLAIEDLRSSSVSAFAATVSWRTNVPSSVRVSYGLPGGGPTIWADVESTDSGSKALLRGLVPGTAYKVFVDAVADDGQRAQAALDLQSPGLPSSPAAAIGKPVGALMLDGQPFFPMMVWSQCPDGYGQNLASGINLFALNPCGGLQAQLNALGGRALSAALSDQPGGSGPGLIGYFHPDEPDGRGLTGAELPPSPYGGVSFLTLTNHFYSGASPLAAGRGIYPGLIAKADVVGFDLYPLQEWCRPATLGEVFDSQKELVALASEKPTFQWIEAAEWKCPGGATAVTPATVRAESWLAIAGGAHGLGFFPGSWSPAVGAAIKGVSVDVARLGPAAYMPSHPAHADENQVRVGARVWQGALYVIAVNSGFTPMRTRITVPGLDGRPLTVLDAWRRIGSVGDTFTDVFAPLAVHLYVAAPADS